MTQSEHNLEVYKKHILDNIRQRYLLGNEHWDDDYLKYTGGTDH